MRGETAWIAAARSGSADAFSNLVRAHQAAVRSFLALYVRPAAAADDLAQETFLAAFRSLDTYRGDAAFRVWLLGIARHRALNYLKEERVRARGMRDVLDEAVAAWRAARAESAVAEGIDARLDALRACMSQLPPPQAALIQEVYFRGRPAAELAREGGRGEGSVWMALTRIRQALRACVEGRLSEAGA